MNNISIDPQLLPITINIELEKNEIIIPNVAIYLKNNNTALFKAVKDYYTKIGNALLLNYFNRQPYIELFNKFELFLLQRGIRRGYQL